MAITTIGGTINSTAVTSNLDYKYGPYTSLQEAYNALGPSGLDKLAIGLTVGILEGGVITEYWFKEGTTLSDLVKKSEGLSAYEIAVQDGYEGTEEEWLASLNGESAYQIAVENGYTGTEQEWLASLKAQFGSFKTLEYNASGPQITASADTTQDIYLMPNAASDPTGQVMWITVDNGENTNPRYEWRSLGETDIATFYTNEVVGQTSIINDLTTGGAHDVLSAEQGKFIANTTMELVDGVNILDPSTITVGEYMKRTNGLPTSASTYGHTDFIELPEGGLICNSCVNNGGSYGCGCCGYAADKTTFLGYEATGTNGAPLFVDKNSTVHSDWVYVIFNIYPNDNDEYMVCKGNTLPSEYVPYSDPTWQKKPIENGSITNEKLANGSVTTKNLDNNWYKFDLSNAAVQSYNQNLFDFYIDKTLLPVTNLSFRIYGTTFFMAYKTSEITSWTSISLPSINLVSNYEKVPIIVNNTQVGYFVLSNKDAFKVNLGSTDSALLDVDRVTDTIYRKGACYDSISKNSLPPDKFNLTNPPFWYEAHGAYEDIYSPCIKELLFITPIDVTLGTFKCYGSTAYLFSYLSIPNKSVFAQITLDDKKNNSIIEIRITSSDDENYPVGTLIGYVVFKDIETFRTTKYGAGTSSLNVINTHNLALMPQISSYIYSQSSEFVPNLRLPDKIYAVVGDTLQLYYRAILDTWTINNYKIKCVCPIGKPYPRYFECTPTSNDIGSKTLRIEVMNQIGKIIASGTTTLEVVSVGNSPVSNKNIFIFGDSLTSGGFWCKEMNRRLTGTGGTPEANGKTNITFCGKMINDDTRFFGRGGWSWIDYITEGRAGFRFNVSNVTSIIKGSIYTNNGYSYEVTEVNITSGTGSIRCDTGSYSNVPESSGILTKTSGGGDATITFSSYEEDSQNPLWDDTNNEFTFIPYVNEYGNGQCDVVYTLLTWNNLPAIDIVTVEESDYDSTKAEIKIFADKLHEEFPNAKLKLIGLQCPSLDGGYADNFGASNTLVDFKAMKAAFYYNKMLQTFANSEGYSSWVEFVDAGFQFDNEYGEQYTLKTVNVRVPNVTEKIGTNSVHPSTEGYMMFADAAYRNFIGNFCQL